MEPKIMDFNSAEKAILRNQRIMMLALANLVRENTKTGNEYHADLLTNRVKNMDRHWEWIASPSERIG
jgi:hypothetical protein